MTTLKNFEDWPEDRPYAPSMVEWKYNLTRVSSAISSRNFNGTMTVTTSGLNAAMDVIQAGSGTASYTTFHNWPHAGFAYNYKLINVDEITLASDTISVGRGIVIGDTVDHVISGAGVNGSRVAHGAFMRQLGTTGNTDITDFVGASWHFAQALAPMVGSSPGTPLGNIFGMCPQVQLYTGATNYVSVMGMEVDVEVDTGASVEYKYGVCITTIGNDAVHGSIQEAALHIGGVPSSSNGWANGIKFSTFNGGGVPIGPSGTLFSTVPVAPMTTWTAAHGIDLRGITLTGFAFASGPTVNSPNFTISGAGNMTANNVDIAGGLHVMGTVALSAPVTMVSLAVVGDISVVGDGGFTNLSVTGPSTLAATHFTGLVTLDQGLNVNGYVTTGQGLSVGGLINLPPMAAPPAPSSGFDLFVDQADGKLKGKASTGNVTVLALP